MSRRALILIAIALIGATIVALVWPRAPGCTGDWHRARLTQFQSYPDPGSEECLSFNGCAWAGRFYGLPGTYSEAWVAEHNIVAVHEKDWDWLGMKTLQLRQAGRTILVEVVDMCKDHDCDGCCTRNLAGEPFLIDIEHYTMKRFGSGSGEVEFRLCE